MSDCGLCPICWADLVHEKISALLCGHTFHYNCVTDWLQKSGACPQCQQPFQPIDVIRLLFFFDRKREAVAASDVPDDKEALKQMVVDMQQTMGVVVKGLETAYEIGEVLRQQRQELKILIDDIQKTTDAIQSADLKDENKVVSLTNKKQAVEKLLVEIRRKLDSESEKSVKCDESLKTVPGEKSQLWLWQQKCNESQTVRLEEIPKAQRS
ncbi:unnamed protein product [Enterobius vermicularis]|uniref:RING-type domain-containing protein n=1 Tax=Enterobius vermicularis TaxID=51028 RepID=A0A0N4VDR5_ENTVE|nr:unnamed protein product [Enterobius vermicularis]